MTRTTGRRLATCHHEAGHALARWYFGHIVHRAVVLTAEDVRAGRWALNAHGVVSRDIEGFVEGPNIHRPPYGLAHLGDFPELHASAIASRDQALIQDYAGPIAEAPIAERQRSSGG